MKMKVCVVNAMVSLFYSILNNSNFYVICNILEICVIITTLKSHLSGMNGATVPDFESQQLYAAKGSLHE